jgi:hypothetical protein
VCANGCGVWLPDWLPIGPTHYEWQAGGLVGVHYAFARSAASAVVGLRSDGWLPTGLQQFELGRHQRRLGRRPDRLAEGPPSRVRPAQQRPDPQRALTAIRSLSSFAALRHPEHALLIQRVLAIPPKRFDKRIVSFLTAAEIAALISVRRLVAAARRAGRGAAGVGVGRGGCDRAVAGEEAGADPGLPGVPRCARRGGWPATR